MKRKPSGLLVFGVVLILLQLLSFAGQLKGGGNILPQSSGPLGRIHPYDLGVFLVSVLPGIIGAALVVRSAVRSKRSQPPTPAHEASPAPSSPASFGCPGSGPCRFLVRGVPMWLFLLTSAALAVSLFLLLWQQYYLPIRYAENTASYFAEKETAAREEGHETGYEEGHDAGYKEGKSAGYEDGYAHGKLVYYWEADFFRRSACIVTEAGKKYHHYGCYHIGNSSFWIYNVELADAKGYTPCLDCWEQGLDGLILPPLS